MKKIKFIMGVALVCALAFTCFAFVGCGDPFDIDMSKQATEEEFKAFNENVAKANTSSSKSEIPAAYAGKSFTVKLKMEMKTDSGAAGNMDMKYDLGGVVNFSDTPSLKFSGDMSVNMMASGITSSQQGTMEMTTVSGVTYIKTKSSGTEAKIKLKNNDLFDTMMGSMGSTDIEADMSLSEFVNTLKTATSALGLTSTPEVYISDRVMKVKLSDTSYIGVAYDNNWHVEAMDYVIKTDASGLAGLSGNLNMEMSMRRGSEKTITAPSDADEYIESDAGIF